MGAVGRGEKKVFGGKGFGTGEAGGAKNEWV